MFRSFAARILFYSLFRAWSPNFFVRGPHN